jgi:hypothetical protein
MTTTFTCLDCDHEHEITVIRGETGMTAVDAEQQRKAGK